MVQDERAALGREVARDGGADAARAAGDDGELALEGAAGREAAGVVCHLFEIDSLLFLSGGGCMRMFKASH